MEYNQDVCKRDLQKTKAHRTHSESVIVSLAKNQAKILNHLDLDPAEPIKDKDQDYFRMNIDKYREGQVKSRRAQAAKDKRRKKKKEQKQENKSEEEEEQIMAKSRDSPDPAKVEKTEPRSKEESLDPVKRKEEPDREICMGFLALLRHLLEGDWEGRSIMVSAGLDPVLIEKEVRTFINKDDPETAILVGH